MTLRIPVDGDTFATRSASMIAIPAYPGFEHRPRWLHADGAPDRTAFAPVAL
jgi:hypothetical protein